ncbi:MAG: glycosyltransferase family 2 protein [Acidimicrobiia bacterium]|nr:glycosyltransferase family 2 protein [Acidimicrobiia bacterium]
MVRLLLRPIEFALLGLIGYNLAVALFGWRDRPSAPRAIGSVRRFRVVIPAHNEARVIGSLLGDLAEASGRMPSEVVVIADHCTDETTNLARKAGVTVAERTEGSGGKGAALSWYLDDSPLADDEALVVLDADNRVPEDLLERFNDELAAGHSVLQAYLGISNPDASPLATASALSYWASNRMVQLARRNLGWTADLGGTGMCIASEALEAVGGFGTSFAEDQELGVKLFEAGHTVTWLHDVRILDEKPADVGVAVRQRSRWAAGRSQVAREHVLRLIRTGRPAAIDLAIRLVQPSRMGVAVLSAALAGASALGAPTMGFGAWSLATVLQVTAPIGFLWREGVERRHLVKYPVLTVLPLLKLPARLIRRRGWYHTPHSG